MFLRVDGGRHKGPSCTCKYSVLVTFDGRSSYSFSLCNKRRIARSRSSGPPPTSLEESIETYNQYTNTLRQRRHTGCTDIWSFAVLTGRNMILYNSNLFDGLSNSDLHCLYSAIRTTTCCSIVLTKLPYTHKALLIFEYDPFYVFL